MATLNINFDQVSGNVKAFFLNYNVSTYKLKKLYNRKSYKKIIDFLVSVAGRPSTKEAFNLVVPTLEQMTEADFMSLCYLEKLGRLEEFLILVRLGAREL